MSRFLKAGLIFFLSPLVFLISSLQCLYAQCSFTNLNSSYCVNQPSFALTGGTNYFGPGVTGNSFDPGVAGVGIHQLVTTNGLASSYSIVSSGTFNPEPPVSPTTVILNDNDEQLVNIGFTFNFFGTDYTQLRIGSNGILGLGAGPPLTSVNDNQALSDATNPNNIIALAWDDLTPDVSGTIRYFVVGATPFRKFVVDYVAVDRTTAFNVTVQAQLYETTNIIEIHTTSAPFATNGESATQGIESQDLGSGVTSSYGLPARNNAQWNATNDFISFVPTCLDIQTVTINALPSAALTVSPASTFVCAGSIVPVTIISASAGVLYQLRNNATNAPLSGFFLGTGANLVINSNAILANVTMKVYARHATTLCETDLTNQVAVTVTPAPTVSAAGANQNICGTTATLAANVPTVGSGVWNFAPGGNPDALPLTAFSNTASATSDFTGTAGLTYTLRWTITNGSCTASFDDVQIRLDQAPTTSVSGGNQTICGTTANLNGTLPVIGTGQWSFAPGGNPGGLGVISDINSRTSLFTGAAGVSYILRWTISNGTCPSSFSDATINFQQTPTVANAGGNQDFCGTTVTLAGNAAAIGTGAWSFAPGGNPDALPLTAFSNTASATSDFTGTAGLTYTLRWTITNGSCTASFDDVQIRLDQAPTTSVSGGNQTICGTTANLNGTLPVIGTGQWSFAPGGNPGGLGVISDINSRTSLFTGAAGVSYILRWTISNGTCPSSFSDATINFQQTPTVANAGGNQDFCGTTVTLAGNAAAIGTGAWSFAPGGNPDALPLTAFSNTASATSDFTGTAGLTYTLRWTITNGSCTASFDDVQIRLDQAPTTSVSGGNQTICGTTANLNGTLPVIGTGQWSFAPGGNPGGLGVISDINSRTSLFTGAAGVSYILRWTISNGTCPSSFSDATINFQQTPTVANAGGNQDFCGTTVTLAGNAAAIGTGAWSFAPGGNPDALPLTAFSNTASATSDFTGTAGLTYTLRWTITNGSCTASFDDVQIRLDQAPTTSVSGGNQTICGTTANLNGTLPVIGTGQWSFAPGGNPGGLGVISDINSRTSLFTGAAGVSYILRWTISNGTCPSSFSDATINFQQTPTVSNAGGNQDFCGTTVTLGANVPAIGTGSWNFAPGGNPDALPLTAFSNTASATSDFTGTAGLTYTLRWTITNGSCTASFDDVQIRLDQAPTTSVSGGNQTICGTTANLNGTLPVIGTGQWSFAPGGNPGGLGVISDINSRTSLFTGAAGVSYILRWTISNGTCPSSFSDATINFQQTPTVSNAGGNQDFCGTTVTLAGNAAAIGTGAWSFAPGGNPDALPLTAFSNTASATSDFTGTAGLTYTLRWTITNGSCTASFDDVQIRLDQAPTTSVSGGNQTICGTTANLNGTLPVIGTGQWSFAPGGNPGGLGVISDINSRTSLFTGAAGVSYILRWTISNGTCPSSFSDATINFQQTPTVSNAGGNQDFCGTTVTLGANVPAIGTGAWNFAPGGNPDALPLTAFSNTASATSDFTGTAGLTYTLRWTITNGSCTASFDDVQIRLDQAPTTSVSGGNQTICGTTANLNGTLPVIGTGQWSFAPGGNPGGLGVISDINSRTSLFTGAAGVSYILRWTISNGTCPSSFSDATINFQQTPTVANAGGNQDFCGTTVTLAGNAAAIGTGAWNFAPGGNPDALPLTAFSNTASATSDFTGTAGLTYTLRWTITNGSCTASFDDVQIRLDQAPTTSVSGGNQTICGTTTNLNGTLPVIGTGQWSFAPGGNPGGLGVISDINSRTSLFTGAAGVSYILRWTISNGTCPSSFSDATINFQQTPTVANAGGNQDFCGTTVTLAGNAAAIGTGAWNFAPGGNPDALPLTAFSNTASATSDFTGTAGLTYTLRWTITNGSCTASFDDVQIRLDQAPTTSVSGGNQTICGTTANLNGTLPVIGTGQWSFAPGGNPGGLGVISDINSRTSLFTGAAGVSYILRWTISNGTCPSSFSDATINFQQTPTVANAGGNQDFCGTTVTLGANVPAIGTGAWNFAPGGNPDALPLTAFSNTASATSDFTGTAGLTYTLRWTITNGSCTASFDDVQIRLDQAPTTSVSGGNQTICGTTANLNGTLPVIGTGQWSFASNPDGLGVITDVNSRTSLFTGTVGQSYILTWTISNGTCAPSFSNVTINFEQAPTAANAGGDQDFCSTTVTLGANVPAIGTGSWNFAPGGNPDPLPLTAFSDTSSPTSDFTGTAGQTYVLRWTITSGSCIASFDDVQVSFDQAPTTSVSGGNQTICGKTTNLNGTLPVIGTGQWSFASNPDGLGVISDINSRTSLFTGTAGQSYILTWTISNGTCAPSSSNVTINFEQAPTAANAGGDQDFCGTTVTLGANVPAIGTGSWNFAPGGNPDPLPLTAFSDTSSPTSDFTGTAGQIYVLRWTITSGSCIASFDDVQIRLDQAPTTSVSGGNQTICGTTATLNGTLPVIGTGQWSFASNPDGLGVISDINSRTSLFTGTAGQSYILTWTISNGTCAPSSSNVTINFEQTPTAANAGGDQDFCGTTVTLGANAAAIGTGAWSFAPGGNPDALPLTAFSNTASATSDFTGTAGLTYTLRWTITNGSCTASFDDVQIRLDQAPTTSVSGGNQTICGTTANLNGTLPVIGTGQWSFAPGGNPGGLGVISDINSRTSLFTGAAGVSYILRWTISNGTCPSSFSDATINFQQTPTVANAGGNQDFCGTTVTLAGNAAAIGTGAWSFAPGGNPDALPLTAFSNTASATSDFTGTAGLTYTLRWTIANGICTVSFDDVQIHFDANPLPAADAGTNQTLCATSTILAANAATTGVGKWTIISGVAGSFVDGNSPTTIFYGVSGETYDLQWTISNGVCPASSDNVTIQFNTTPTVATAGPDQTLCATSATLAGNTPATGSGQWTIMSGIGGGFLLDTDPTTTFSGVAGTTYVLQWTITSGVCTPSSDQVTIRFDENPLPIADAGTPQTLCSTSATLAGNAPTTGTGTWTIISGAGGSLVNANSPTTVFNGVSGTTYDLQWTISNGVCPSTSDIVQIQFDLPPTPALAGPNQNLCAPTAILAANNPAIGTGQWTIVSGVGGSFVLDSDPTTTFNGISGNNYILRWTTSNGVCSTQDDMQILFYPIPDVDAVDKTICSGSNASVVIDNPNGVSGTTFSWTVFSSTNVTGAAGGNGSLISQILSNTDPVNSGTVVYRITPSANGCAGTPIDVTVTVTPKPFITDPPTSFIQEICSGTPFNFTPTSPVLGTTYNWTTTIIGTLTGVNASGSGTTIADNPVNGTNSNGVIIYTITPTIGGCDGTPVNLVLTVRPVTSAAATNQIICSGESTSIGITNPNNVTGTTYSWTAVATNVSGASNGSGSTISQLLINTHGSINGSVVYTITPSANGCPGPTYNVTATVKPVPVMTNPVPSLSQQICSGAALSFVPTSTIGGTTFSWTSSISGTISAASVTASGVGSITDSPINTGSAAGTVTYRITPSFNGCNGLPVDLVVTVKPEPSATASNQIICSGQAAIIGITPLPKSVAGTTFAWTAVGSANVTGWANGNGSTINQTLSTTNQFVGTVTYTIVPTANSCDGPATIITVTVNPVATANAGPNFAICEPVTIPVSGTIGGSATTGIWSIVGGSGFGTISASTTMSGTVTATYTVNASDIGGQVRLLLTSNDPDGVGPCTTASDELIIDVNRRPIVTVPADYRVCEPSSISLAGTLSGSATTGIWTLLTGTGTLSASSVTGSNVTASYTPSAGDVGNPVRFRLTSNVTGVCAAGFDDIEIRINQTARVDAGLDFEVCEDEIVNLNGSFSGATSSVTWTGGAGGAFSNASNPITSYTLTAADIAAGGISFSLTSNDPDGGGPAGPCGQVVDQVFVKINKLPEVFLFGLQPTYAENNGVVTLDGIPVGGTFTGSGIIAGTNQFDPGSAALGPVNITYTYTNPITGCTNDTTRSTIVNPVTSVDFDIENQTTDLSGNPQICANSGSLELIGYPGASTGYPQTLFRSLDIPTRIENVGLSDFYVNTDGLAPGTYQIQYIYTNSLGATDTLTKAVTVFGAPKAIIDFDRVCVSDSLTYTDASYIPINPASATIVAYDWSYGEFGNGNDGVTRNPKYKYTDHGSKTVGLTVTTSQGCSHDTTRIIRVGPLPIVDFTWSKVCSGLEVTEFRDLSTTPLGYSQISEYQWNFGDGDILAFGPRDQNVPPGTHGGRTTGTYTNPNHDYNLFTTFNVQLTVTTEDGCTGVEANDVIILDYVTPTASGGYSTDFEIGSNPWVVSTTSSNSSWLYGAPTGNVIQPSASGNYAWWTGNNADSTLTFSTFNNDETSEVLSPCLNLTDLKRPMISLDYWSDFRGAFDGAVVQFSTDDGTTWQTIGNADGYGINWYDTQNITSNVGGQDNFAWSGSKPTERWMNARFNLDQIPPAERDLVRFRIAFASNGDNPTGEILNGFAFDNIYIGEKNRNVLVEHFTNDNSASSNNSDQFLEDMYNDQIDDKDSSDFIVVQFHMAGDDINLENPSDPTARQQLYGVSQAPTTVMDGIQGQYFGTNFNGLLANITAQEIDRRSLEDPSFAISIDTVATGDNTTLGLNIRYTYIDPLKPLDIPVTFHAALIERGINGNGNVVRKLLLGSDGHTITGIWDASVPTEHDEIFDYVIDIPITNPDSLYILAFVQDNSESTITSRRILQSKIVKAPRKVGPVITGIEDSPTIAELKGLVVYPNPASRVVNLHSDINFQRSYTWKLIDQRGVTVLTGNLQKDFSFGDQAIEVSTLPNGMYIMAIQINDKSVVHKKIAVMNKD